MRLDASITATSIIAPTIRRWRLRLKIVQSMLSETREKHGAKEKKKKKMLHHKERAYFDTAQNKHESVVVPSDWLKWLISTVAHTCLDAWHSGILLSLDYCHELWHPISSLQWINPSGFFPFALTLLSLRWFKMLSHLCMPRITLHPLLCTQIGTYEWRNVDERVGEFNFSLR